MKIILMIFLMLCVVFQSIAGVQVLAGCAENQEISREFHETAMHKECGRWDVLQKLPGRIYDDLGNVISYEPNYFLMKYGIKPSKDRTLTPVVCEIPDYSGMYFAYVYSDVTVAKKNLQPERYWPGDYMPIITKAPIDIEKLTAIMPNGDEVALTYDEKAKAWHGIWEIPEDITEGTYKAKIIAVDFEGYKIETETSAFIIGKPETLTGKIIEEKASPAKEAMVPKEEAAAVKEPVRLITPEVVATTAEAVKPAQQIGLGIPEKIIPIPEPAPKIEEKKKEITEADYYELVEKYLGEKLGPDQKLSRAELAYVVARAKFYDLRQPISSTPFKDVKTDHWAARAIKKCVEHGVLDGYPDKTFRPDEMISLAELISIISGSEFLKDPKGKIAGEHWAMTCVRATLAAKILRSEEKPLPSTLNFKTNFKKIIDLYSRTETFNKAVKAE